MKLFYKFVLKLYVKIRSLYFAFFDVFDVFFDKSLLFDVSFSYVCFDNLSKY